MTMADGGFSSNAVTKVVESHETTVYSSVKATQNKATNGVDPSAPLKGDSSEIASWLQRMRTKVCNECCRQRSSELGDESPLTRFSSGYHVANRPNHKPVSSQLVERITNSERKATISSQRGSASDQSRHHRST